VGRGGTGTPWEGLALREGRGGDGDEPTREEGTAGQERGVRCGLPADASSFVSRVPLDLAREQEGVSVCVTRERAPLRSCRHVAPRATDPASSLETVDSLGQLRPRGFWRFSHGRPGVFPRARLLSCICRRVQAPGMQ
jgi:hypothetical protein